MAKKSDSGAAFPLSPSAFKTNEGMTLRDWFAGQCAAAAIVNAQGIDETVAKAVFPMVAKLSYMLADAMIAARGAE